jgi:hypothetical protein
MILWIYFLFVQLIFRTAAQVSSEKHLKMTDYLFPNKTMNHHSRILKDPYTTTVPCVICRSLSYCSALNNLMVQENYYPDNLDLLGACYVIESLGERMSSEIFGLGKSFRDTLECRGKCFL